MNIFYEAMHTGHDREVLLTPGCDFTVVANWPHHERPLPPCRIAKEPEEAGPYDLAVLGTDRFLRMKCPKLYRYHINFGHEPFPRHILEQIDFAVFTNWESAERCGMGDDPRSKVIEHAIDCDLFSGWHGEGPGEVLFVGNNIPRRKEKGPDILWAVDAEIQVDLYGYANEGYRHSIGAASHVEELVEVLRRYKIYFNSSCEAGVSTLEAMAVGMPVVTMEPGNFKSFMQDGKNCLVARTVLEAAKRIRELLETPSLRAQLGGSGRCAVLGRFEAEGRRKEWKYLFDETVAKSRV